MNITIARELLRRKMKNSLIIHGLVVEDYRTEKFYHVEGCVPLNVRSGIALFFNGLDRSQEYNLIYIDNQFWDCDRKISEGRDIHTGLFQEEWTLKSNTNCLDLKTLTCLERLLALWIIETTNYLWGHAKDAEEAGHLNSQSLAWMRLNIDNFSFPIFWNSNYIVMDNQVFDKNEMELI
jgi:hypothetical protein